MLELDSVGFEGRHGPLISQLDFAAPDGELSMLAAPTPMARTAVSLVASGRMRPDHGAVFFDGHPETKTIRASSALVDSPGITAPEHHLRVKDLVAESLGLHPRTRGRQRLSPGSWIRAHEIEDLDTTPVDALAAQVRIWLLTELAFSNSQVRLAVLDSPDRHEITAQDLSEVLAETVAPQGRSVVAVLSQEAGV